MTTTKHENEQNIFRKENHELKNSKESLHLNKNKIKIRVQSIGWPVNNNYLNLINVSRHLRYVEWHILLIL